MTTFEFLKKLCYDGLKDRYPVVTKEIQDRADYELSIIKDDTIHDRFLILDNSLCYSLGTSLNYIGKKTFVITKIEDETIVKAIINRTINKKYSHL